MSTPEDPAAKAYRILTETDPLWDLISPAGTAAGLLGDLPTDPHQAVMGLLATPSPAERLLSSLAPPPPDLFERGVGALEREAERRSENMDGMREELTEIKTKLEALAASKAEPEATPLPAKPGPPAAPEKRPALRRAFLPRILEALRELDPTFNPAAMPGRKVDFLSLCKAVAPHLFNIELDAFDKARKGLCRFAPGARETTYYREKLPAVRAKLG